MLEPKKVRMLVKKSSLTKKELNDIKEFLNYCSEKYYNTDEKYISDGDYDYYYERYVELGGKPFMGAEPPKDEDIEYADHKYQELVGTTLKAHNIKEFGEWLENVYKNLKLNKSKDTLVLCTTLKFDGNSILIEYDKNGKVIKALTRGKNGKGIDKTKTFKDFSIINPFKVPLAIKYEVIVRYSVLPKLNKAMNVNYVNPRSACGKLTAKDSKDYVNYFTLEPLWMKLCSNDKEKMFNKLNSMRNIYVENEISWREIELNYFNNIYNGSKDNTDYLAIMEGNYNDIMNDIQEIYNQTIEDRTSLDFMIDGLVVDVCNDSYREKLGFIDGGENLKPKWCIAIKFPYMEEESTVTNIKFSMGDSGRISPVCYFEPVKFNGGTHTKQYLQGYKRFNELKLCKGTRIRIEYHNDCLSYIERLDSIEDDKKHKREPIPFIDCCPVCGEDLEIVEDKDGIGTSAYCKNPYCPGNAKGKINNFFKKMDIKGIKINTIDKLYNAGLWKEIKDIYTFDPEEAYDIEGLGESSINKMVRSIEKKKYYDYEILASLGIRNFGLDTAKTLCQSMDLDYLLDRVINEDKMIINLMQNIEGIAKILADNIYKGILDNKETIEFLMKRGYKQIKEENNYDSNRYTFVITGDLETCSRDVMKRILELHGHKLVGSVSGKTDYLITNTPKSGTVKNKKAQELGKEIITEKQLIKLLNLDMDKEIEKHSHN